MSVLQSQVINSIDGLSDNAMTILLGIINVLKSNNIKKGDINTTKRSSINLNSYPQSGWYNMNVDASDFIRAERDVERV